MGTVLARSVFAIDGHQIRKISISWICFLNSTFPLEGADSVPRQAGAVENGLYQIQDFFDVFTEKIQLTWNEWVSQPEKID